MAIIETKALTKTYGKILAVRGIDLNIEKGEIFGIIVFMKPFRGRCQRDREC